MALTQSGSRHQTDFGGTVIGWVVSCDTCRTKAKRDAEDPGDAAERARKEGFTTKPMGRGEPMAWVCPKCNVTHKTAAPKKSTLPNN
jgi:hypothetical protein